MYCPQHVGKNSAPLYRHWGSVQAVRPIGVVGVQLYSFLTTALEGGEVSVSRPGRSLPPGKTWYPLRRRLGGPQDRSGQVRKISSPSGFDPHTVQPAASRYTNYAINMQVFSTICSNKLATSSVCEFTDSRSLYLFNIFSDVSSWPPTYVQTMPAPALHQPANKPPRTTNYSTTNVLQANFPLFTKVWKVSHQTVLHNKQTARHSAKDQSSFKSRLYRLKLTLLRHVAPPIHWLPGRLNTARGCTRMSVIA